MLYQKERIMPPTSSTALLVPSSDRDDRPKVEQVVQSQPLGRPQTLQMLSRFLMEEQERRTTLREDHGLNSTWKDLQNAYDTLVVMANPSTPTYWYKESDLKEKDIIRKYD